MNNLASITLLFLMVALVVKPSTSAKALRNSKNEVNKKNVRRTEMGALFNHTRSDPLGCDEDEPCNPLAYDEYWFAEMCLYLQEAASELGYTAEKWDTSAPVPSGEKYWADLTTREKELWGQFCWTKEQWCV